MSGWNFDTKEKSSFTKFPVGVTRIRILDDEPHVRWTHWMNQYKKSVNCPGRDCPIDEIRKQQKANKQEYTYNMSRRFAINIYNYETQRVEILEQGKKFFEELRDIMEELKEDGNTLKDAIIKVRRRGTGTDDTSYRLDIDSITPMEDTERRASAKKTDLNDYFKPHTPEQILKLLEGTATTPEGYKEIWNNVMSQQKEDEVDDTDEEEEFQVS